MINKRTLNFKKNTPFLAVSLWILFSSFNFPNEKKFLAQKVENVVVFDAKGNEFELFSLLDGKKPLILSPVYTKCKTLCGLISTGIHDVIGEIGGLGKEFNMVSFSFDSTDKAADLAFYEEFWKMDGATWRTLSAEPDNIAKLMNSVGYEYDYDPKTKEYNHPSILIVLTPSGRVSRFIYGLYPKKKDLNLAIIEAMAEKTRPGLFKGFYLRCFNYDPLSKTYKMDWRFIIGSSTGLLMICIVTTIFIRSFKTSEEINA